MADIWQHMGTTTRSSRSFITQPISEEEVNLRLKVMTQWRRNRYIARLTMADIWQHLATTTRSSGSFHQRLSTKTLGANAFRPTSTPSSKKISPYRLHPLHFDHLHQASPPAPPSPSPSVPGFFLAQTLTIPLFLHRKAFDFSCSNNAVKRIHQSLKSVH